MVKESVNKDNKSKLNHRFGYEIIVNYSKNEVEIADISQDEDGYKKWVFNNESCLKDWLNENTL